MNKILPLLIVMQFFLAITIFAQIEGDYVVKANNDTVPLKLSSWNDYRIICIVNGEKIKLKAKDVFYYAIGKSHGSAGRINPGIIGFKRWTFIENVVKGKMSLYSITGYDKGIDHMNSQSTTSYAATIWYARKSGEPPRVFHKIMSYRRLRLMMNDCPPYLQRIKAKGHSVYDFIEDVEFYNASCGSGK